MEQQAVTQFFPICNDGTFYPENLSRILSTFYNSSKKQFTKQELQHKTNLTDIEIHKGLEYLSRLGEIVENSKDNSAQEYFHFNTEGNVKSLKNNIEKSEEVLCFFEQAIEARNNSNPELNNFIKAQIVFYSEILDFMMVKFNEHFNIKKPNSL